jgi:uncharacterized protein (DUF2249 family)
MVRNAGGGIPRIAQRSEPFIGAARPAGLLHSGDEGLVELDVREELRAGREPFGIIMAAVQALPSGGTLSLRATFEPVPLYTVLGRRGLAHWTEQLADDDWRVWFYPQGAAAEGPEPTPATPGAVHNATDAHDAHDAHAHDAHDDDSVIILDVRNLEPPEPMTRTLEALESLPASATLLQINVRVPQFLLPILEQRGFKYEIREQEPGLVRVFIRHNQELKP